MKDFDLVRAIESLSDILHELEASGVELTDDQDDRWAKATDVLETHHQDSPPRFTIKTFQNGQEMFTIPYKTGQRTDEMDTLVEKHASECQDMEIGYYDVRILDVDGTCIDEYILIR